MSGVYYVKVPPTAGKLLFTDPRGPRCATCVAAVVDGFVRTGGVKWENQWENQWERFGSKCVHAQILFTLTTLLAVHACCLTSASLDPHLTTIMR